MTWDKPDFGFRVLRMLVLILSLLVMAAVIGEWRTCTQQGGKFVRGVVWVACLEGR